jgi:NAD(P)-dependent dehydrogenase (short-subunit alcohol dehydrogenase family)
MSVLDLFRIDGRAALVTGGNRGIGRAIAEAFAEAGASVALTSRDRTRAQQAAQQIAAQTGSRCLGLELDVRDQAGVESVVAHVLQEWGAIDILVNNAGVNIREDIFSVSDETWETTLATNLTGAMRCARAVVGQMKERGWGRIINLGSILSVIGIAQRAPYAASKHGILGLTRAMALDLAPYGVTVNALCPGPFKTEINRPVLRDPEYLKEFLRKVPLGRMGDPAELKGAALFLASEASSFVTGSALFVDGGWTAQ